MISFKQFLFEEKIDIDNKIKEQLAKNAEDKLKNGDFWANKTPAEQEAALKEARKKAIDDYDNLSEKDKQKQRDKYIESQTKKSEEPEKSEETEKGDSKESEKSEEPEKSEEKSEEAEKGDSEETEKEKSEEIAKKEDTEKSEEPEKSEEIAKKEDTEKSEEIAKKEDTEKSEEIAKKEDTEEKEKSEESEKTEETEEKEKSEETEEGSKFLDKISEIDKKFDEVSTTYNVMKKVGPNILTIAALCCPIGALTMGGVIGLGFVLASVFKACKKNDDKETIKAVTTDIKNAAQDQKNEDALKEIDAFEKSAFTKDGELATDEDFELNLEKNGLEEVAKDLKKNETTLEEEVDVDKVQQAAGKIKDEKSEETEEKEKSEETEEKEKSEKSEEKEKSEKSEETEELTNKQIEELQDELSNLDKTELGPAKYKEKFDEIISKLENAAKNDGKDTSEYVVKIDKDENGNTRQHKTGPRGGKYYRVKGKNGWGPWNSNAKNESLLSFLQVSMSNINENKSNNLSEYLNKTITK